MKNKNFIGLGISLGAGIGSALGVAMDNLAMGIAMGVGIGLAIGAGLSQMKKNEEDKNDNTGEWFPYSKWKKTIPSNGYK